MTALWAALLGLALAGDADGQDLLPDADLPLFPVPELHRLASGVPVWILSRPELPRLRVEISLRGGMMTSDDPLALQLATVLLDEGTRSRPGEAWAKDLAQLGARVDVGAGSDRVWADVELLAGDEDEALELVSDLLRQARLPGPDLRRSRRAWQRSARRNWSSAETVAGAAFARALYPPDHVLGRIWGPEDHRRLSRRRVRQAWDQARDHSSPAILVVGAASADRLLPLLEEHLGWLLGRSDPPSIDPPRPQGERLILVDHPGVSLARLALSIPAPPTSDPSLPAFELDAEILCGAYTSRMNQRLRLAEGWTYGVSCRIDARPEASRLVIELPLAPEDVAPAMVAMEEILAQAALDLPSPDEARAARNSLRVQTSQDLLSDARVAWRLGNRLTQGQAADAEAQAFARAAQLEVEALALAARGLDDRSDRLWLIVGDARAIEPLLAEADRPPDLLWTGRAVTARRGQP